jgi:hypothetical protein
VRLTGIVVEDHSLVYVPVPKVATTSILASLAELAGIDPTARLGSRKLEVTRSATVHDGSLWAVDNRLGARGEGERRQILGSEDWFRFTVVREPAHRIWSAWVSKVLVRDPRFVASFGADLFPPRPSSAADVVAAFRAFMTGLPTRSDWHDPHWSSQLDLIGSGDIRYDHVGRLDELAETEHAVRAYVRRRNADLLPFARENQSFVPFSQGLFDPDAYEACVEWTEDDCEAFAYEPLAYPRSSPDEAWHARVEAAIPTIRAITDRNLRFLDVWRLMEDGTTPADRTHRVAQGVADAISSGLRRLRVA